MTVKKRITLLVIGAGFVTSLLFSVLVFFELLEQPFEILDAVLKEEAYRATRMAMKGQEKSEETLFRSTVDINSSYWIEVYEKGANRILYQSDLAKLVKLPPVTPGSSANASVIIPLEPINLGQDSSREVTFRIRTFLLTLEGRTVLVQIARPIEKLEDEIWDLVFNIGAGLIFSCMVLVVISHFIAGKILKPIGEMKVLAKEISEKNLNQRIQVGSGRDEFNELGRTINWMLDRLQNSFENQRNLLFDTSHELKTPLTTMRLAIDEICTSDTEKLPVGVKENLFRLNNYVLRMERLVKDLLNLSSLETITGLDPKPVHITELLSSLAADYGFLADAQNIQMDLHLSPQLIIQGDVEKLTRAFSNILDNAVKYNEDDGRIEVDCDQSDVDVTITITNTGPGVVEAEIDKVFDQFYRVERSRSLQHGGSGLGLAIVKKIVALHNGTVKFESEPGEWTRVTVSLPRRQEMTSHPTEALAFFRDNRDQNKKS